MTSHCHLVDLLRLSRGDEPVGPAFERQQDVALEVGRGGELPQKGCSGVEGAGVEVQRGARGEQYGVISPGSGRLAWCARGRQLLGCRPTRS